MEHICDYSALLSVESLDKFIKDDSEKIIPKFNFKFNSNLETNLETNLGIDLIFNEEKQHTKRTRTRTKREISDKQSEQSEQDKQITSKKRISKQNKVFKTFDQPDVLIAVQNDNKFLNFIMSIRHISPNVFMYVEGVNYLVFIVNSADSYPVVMAKFQIIHPTIIQRNISDVWFSFPIATIADFITKTDKSSYQYSFILRNLESQMVLEYTSTLDNVMKSSKNINQVDKQITLDIVFFNKIQIIKEFEEDIGIKGTDYISMIYNMPILLLTECKDFGLIEKIKNLERAEEVIEISDESIILNIDINSQINKITIVNRTNKISGLIYWSELLEPMRLKMPNFTSLFKTTDRLKNKNEFCYYLLCKWKTYEKAETYMFIKIVSKMRIEKIEPGITFGQLFNDGNLLYELFFCYHPKNEKQISDSNVNNINFINDIGFTNDKEIELDMDFI